MREIKKARCKFEEFPVCPKCGGEWDGGPVVGEDRDISIDKCVDCGEEFNHCGACE